MRRFLSSFIVLGGLISVFLHLLHWSYRNNPIYNAMAIVVLAVMILMTIKVWRESMRAPSEEIINELEAMRAVKNK